ARELQLVVAHVDGDDARGPCQPGTLHHVQPDAAGADHGYVGARLDARRVDRGADPRRDPAADERRLGQRRVRANRHAVELRDDRALAERAEPRELQQRLVAQEQARARRLGPTEVALAAPAVAAASTADPKHQNHVVARAHAAHARTDAFDDARALVAK